jgi:hypothetical protein
MGSQSVGFLATWAEIKTSPKINKYPSTEEILCTTDFYKLPGLPQRSQISMNIKCAGSIFKKEI